MVTWNRHDLNLRRLAGVGMKPTPIPAIQNLADPCLIDGTVCDRWSMPARPLVLPTLWYGYIAYSPIDLHSNQCSPELWIQPTRCMAKSKIFAAQDEAFNGMSPFDRAVNWSLDLHFAIDDRNSLPLEACNISILRTEEARDVNIVCEIDIC